MLKNISYLKFKRFYAPNPRKLNWYEIAWRWAQCYVNQRHCEKHLRRLSQKKCQNHDHKQQQFTLTWRIWWTRQCRVFIFGHHTEQQQVHKIKSKCYLNVLHFKKRWCCPARKNSCMFGESSFRKSSRTVYLFTRFDIYPVKILLTMSLVLVKHKGKLVMLARSYVPRESQTPVTAICMRPKRLLSQNSRVQNANLCHKFQFGHFN